MTSPGTLSRPTALPDLSLQIALSTSTTVIGLSRLEGGSRKAGRTGSLLSLNSPLKYSFIILAFSLSVPALFPAELWTVKAGLAYPL